MPAPTSDQREDAMKTAWRHSRQPSSSRLAQFLPQPPEAAGAATASIVTGVRVAAPLGLAWSCLRTRHTEFEEETHPPLSSHSGYFRHRSAG